ncbi:hypothetical protein ACOME3_002919 [Neoechinorhynchus agilis]
MQVLKKVSVKDVNLYMYDGLRDVDENTPNLDESEFLEPAIVVIDNVHVYIGIKRQTFIYKILDWSSPGIDIANDRSKPKKVGRLVIGLTSKLDCLRCMEKRVSSRFYHKTIMLPLLENKIIYELVGRQYYKKSKLIKNAQEKLNALIDVHGNDVRSILAEFGTKSQIGEDWVDLALKDMSDVHTRVLMFEELRF